MSMAASATIIPIVVNSLLLCPVLLELSTRVRRFAVRAPDVESRVRKRIVVHVLPTRRPRRGSREPAKRRVLAPPSQNALLPSASHRVASLELDSIQS